MAPQNVDLVLGELKHEVGREALDIALDRSVERLGFHAEHLMNVPGFMIAC